MTSPNPVGVRLRVRLGSGEPVELSPVLARAGEGTVYGVVDRPRLAAKVFHPTLKDRETKLEKVAAMVESVPPGAVQPNGFAVLTWPSHVIVDSSGPVGFAMPRISTATAVELHTISNPADRADPLPSRPQWTRHVTWTHLVNAAANLCLAVEEVHRVDAVIGDFQERNILVSDTTEVTLVDCDSMQFTDKSGRQFLCGVGRPEYLAPELAGVDLRTHTREKTSDLFALAVHIHQLLMAGNHPFLRGVWSGPGEQPDTLALAKAGMWAGGSGSPLRTHPMAPPISLLPDPIQQLFERAFTQGAKDPGSRPTAQEWREALLAMQVTQCSAGIHQVPVGTGQCPWCVIDDAREARRSARQIAGATAAGPRTAPIAKTPLDANASGDAGRKLDRRTKLIVGCLLTFVAVVIVLTVYVVWGITHGASPFGL